MKDWLIIIRRQYAFYRLRSKDRPVLRFLLQSVFWIGIFLSQPFTGPHLGNNPILSIQSNDGTLLYRYRDATSGGHSEKYALGQYPSDLVDLVVHVEDRYYNVHPGVNVLSLLRAAYQTITNARIVSGGSTITMQLARINGRSWMPASPWLRKVCEVFIALSLEARYSKSEILTHYLNKVPMPANNTGLASAARRLFGRPLGFLTSAEKSVLVASIRSPSAHRNELESRARGVLKILTNIRKPTKDANNANNETRVAGGFQAEIADEAAVSTAVKKLIRCRTGCSDAYISQKMYAPHYVDWLRQSILTPRKLSGRITTSLDANLNNDIQNIIGNELAALSNNNVKHAAVVAIELGPDSVSLAALVGSADYSGDTDGQNNGAASIRNAGSSLKPFIYAQAMEQLDLKPYSRLRDEPETFTTTNPGEVFLPKNYDLNYWGNLTLAESLATSRNIPAVHLLQEIGPARFFGILERLGMTHLQQNRPESFGPGLALGAGGTRLLELVHAYSVFAQNGRLEPLFIGTSEGKKVFWKSKESISVFREKTAGYITEILMNDDLRRKAFGSPNFLEFPFEVAAKTGTSKDYRDAWTVGYNSKWVVGVWTGNFSAEPMRGVSGAFGAGRIFQQVMRRLPAGPIQNQTSSYPKTRICYFSGLSASDICPAYQFRLSAADIPQRKCSGSGAEHSIGGDIAVLNTLSASHYQNEADLSAVMDTTQIKSPKNGEVFILDDASGSNFQEVPLWFDQQSVPLHSAYRINSGQWKPVPVAYQATVALSRGFHSLELKNAGKIQRVDFEVQ